MMRTIRINQNTFVNSLLDGRKFLPFFFMTFYFSPPHYRTYIIPAPVVSLS